MDNDLDNITVDGRFVIVTTKEQIITTSLTMLRL